MLSFKLTLRGVAKEQLLIDYVIDFVKANRGTKPKVFKWKTLGIKKGEEVVLEKNHRLLADATTFRLHKGIHTLTIQINGKKMNNISFELT